MSDWSGVRRVLAVRLDSMGDVLMTTPALRAIRENADHLTLLTSPSGAAAARLVPFIDEVVVHEVPWMKASAPHGPEEEEALIERLRASRFDAAVIFTVFSQTPFPAAMLAYLAGIPRTLAHCRERAYALVSDAVPETEPEQGIRHEVRRHLDLVATVGWQASDERLIAVPSEGDCAVVENLLPSRRPSAGWGPSALETGDSPRVETAFGPQPALGRRDRWAVVHPGASAPSRRWPAKYYVEALTTLAARGWRFLVTGDASERDLVEGIAAAVGSAAQPLPGQLTLGQLAALIERAPLVITNNTGPAHLAAAMQTPVVDLYALTNPQHTPWMVPHVALSHDVECRWCFSSLCKTGHHLCLEGVQPEQVVAAAEQLVRGDVSRAA